MAALSVLALLPQAFVTMMLPTPPDDLLGLSSCSSRLVDALGIDVSNVDEASLALCALHREAIAPLMPATYLVDMAKDDRRSSIEGISRALDTLEEQARGPMLTGSRAAAADADVFPSLVLLEQTLPEHFGWEEWTEESLFWRRPRLHAFFELMKYEKPCKEIESELITRLAALEVPWTEVGIDVPTAQLRKFPKHAP